MLIFVDRAIGGGGGGRGGRGGGGGGNFNPDAGGDANAGDAQPQAHESAPTTSAADRNVPEEFRNRRGTITATRTTPQIRKFLEQGGTVLCIGSSTGLGSQLGLPLTNHLVENGRALMRDKFYVPGSVLTAKLNSEDPIAWGEPGDIDFMFSAGSPVFDLKDAAAGVVRIATFESKTPLHSGWAWGQEHLQGGIAIAHRVGKGRWFSTGRRCYSASAARNV